VDALGRHRRRVKKPPIADGGGDGERKVEVLSPARSVPDDVAIISVLFDTSDEDQCGALHDLRALLQADSDIEALDQDVFALHIFFGTVRKPLP
jgi:hypothetical protein